jgi:hypothetical protein
VVNSSLPVFLPPISRSGINGSCATSDVIEEVLASRLDEIRLRVISDVLPELCPDCPPCACGGKGEWVKVADLDASNTSQECPENWIMTTTPVRGCGRSSEIGCDSAIFGTGKRTYTRVCGRVEAIQVGTPNAFDPSLSEFEPGLDAAYIDGVSLTHGVPGSRQHIWSFVSALYETDDVFLVSNVCSCTDTTVVWPFTIPSFIGEDYFCATGNPGPGFVLGEVYPDNPLWDDEGCGPNNACCLLNRPPWFCTVLPQPTSDDLELRICHDQVASNEDTLVTLAEVYIQTL